MSAESLGRWITGRWSDGDRAVRVMVVAKGAEENKWDIIHDVYEMFGGGASGVAVSSTSGFIDVSGVLHDGRTIHIYIGDEA